jgi:hypothetical protein
MEIRDALRLPATQNLALPDFDLIAGTDSLPLPVGVPAKEVSEALHQRTGSGLRSARDLEGRTLSGDHPRCSAASRPVNAGRLLPGTEWSAQWKLPILLLGYASSPMRLVSRLWCSWWSGDACID